MATKVAGVSWVPRSRMKLANMRGRNCVEANVSVTIAVEKTTPTTVITRLRDGGEDPPSRVGCAADRPRRQPGAALVGRPVDRAGAGEQCGRGEATTRTTVIQPGPQRGRTEDRAGRSGNQAQKSRLPTYRWHTDSPNDDRNGVDLDVCASVQIAATFDRRHHSPGVAVVNLLQVMSLMAVPVVIWGTIGYLNRRAARRPIEDARWRAK